MNHPGTNDPSRDHWQPVCPEEMLCWATSRRSIAEMRPYEEVAAPQDRDRRQALRQGVIMSTSSSRTNVRSA